MTDPDAALLTNSVSAEPIEIDEISEIGQREKLRTDLYNAAGDLPSLVGTTADAAALTLHQLAVLANGLANANSLAEMRAAASPINILLAGFKAGVEDGTIRLPTAYKGELEVLTEIGDRATAVTGTLEANSSA